MHSPIFERSRRGRLVSPDPSYFNEITRVDLAVIAREGGGGEEEEVGVEFQLLKTRKRTERGPSLFRVPGPINVIQGTPSFEARREEEGRGGGGKGENGVALTAASVSLSPTPVKRDISAFFPLFSFVNSSSNSTCPNVNGPT